MAQCCSFRGVFWGLAIFGVVADQVSKYRVFRWLYNDGAGGEFEILPGVFKLSANFKGETETGTGLLASLRTWGGEILPHVNQGALFGLGNNHKEVANGVFAAISIVAAMAIVYWATRGVTKRDGILTIALGLILAGTLGNLYDRLVFRGVRDFLYFYWINWPVFNVADCCLVCGAFLLLVQAFWMRPSVPEPALTEAVKQGETANV
jgi:lipoprotein signal peptidase